MSEPLKRALRTFVQAIVGSLITQGFLSAASTSGVVDWSGLEKLAVAALAAGIISVLTFLQNLLEDTGTVPALGRDVPSADV